VGKGKGLLAAVKNRAGPVSPFGKAARVRGVEATLSGIKARTASPNHLLGGHYGYSFAAWLDASASVKGLKALLRPCAGDDLQAVAVSTFVNNARHEGPRCLEPADEQPGLWDGKA
jgi:hypothetical protein